MKKAATVLSVLVLTFGLCGVAGAYTFELGSLSSLVFVGDTDTVLEMDVLELNPGLDAESFTLGVGESYTFHFATIGTTESWVNPGEDDTNPGKLIATLDFDNPDLEEGVVGASLGVSLFFGTVQGWDVTWEGPVEVSFGDGGKFSISLSNASYRGLLSPAGTDCVDATVTLIAEPVPLPGAVWLLGSGLLFLTGAVRRFRR